MFQNFKFSFKKFKMEEILVNFNDPQQLIELGKRIKSRLLSIKEELIYKNILEDIKLKGYSCQSDYVGDNIQGKLIKQNVCFKILPFHVSLRTHDKINKIDKEDIHVDEYHFEQNDWVRYLHFDYKPTDKDNGYHISSDDWEDNNWDDMACNTATLCMGFYYKISSEPLNNTVFKTFDDNGNIINLKYIDNKICDINNIVSKEYENQKWDELKFYVIA